MEGSRQARQGRKAKGFRLMRDYGLSQGRKGILQILTGLWEWTGSKETKVEEKNKEKQRNAPLLESHAAHVPLYISSSSSISRAAAACSIQELCRQAWKFRYSAFSICRAKWIRSWGEGTKCSSDRGFRPL